jgi:hypothetical protein
MPHCLHRTFVCPHSGTLRSEKRQFLTDLLGQAISPTLKSKESQKWILSGLPIGSILALKKGQSVPKRRQGITITRCVMVQKIVVLKHFAAEAWNLTFIFGYTYEPWESKKSRLSKKRVVIPSTCLTFTDSRWGIDKWPVSVQVHYSHDVTSVHKSHVWHIRHSRECNFGRSTKQHQLFVPFLSFMSK